MLKLARKYPVDQNYIINIRLKIKEHISLLIIFCHINKYITTVFGTFNVMCDLVPKNVIFINFLTPTGQHKYNLQVWIFCT